MAQQYDNVPNELKPLSPWKYFWLSILYTLPVVGFVFLIIHSISRANINRRNFALSHFCVLVLVAIIIGISLAIGLAGTGFGALQNLFKKA